MTETTLTWEGRGIRSDTIARKMLELRTDAADEDGFPLARSSVMNLIIYAADQRHVGRAANLVHELAIRHPSRALVIAPQPGSRFRLDADVQVHVHPVGRHGLAFENAVLHPQGIRPEGLDTLVIPLLIPHLRSVVWWLGDPDPEAPAMRSLTSISDRVIVDSRLGSAGRLEQLSTMHLTKLGDLNWTRLEGVREALARVFDEPRRVPMLDGLHKLSIHGNRGASRPVSAAEVLLAGWVRSRLGTPPAVTFAGARGGARRGTDAPPVQSVKLDMEHRGRKLSVEVSHTTSERVVTVVEDGRRHRAAIAHHGVAEIDALSQELGRMGRDRVYEDSLLSAARTLTAITAAA